MKFLTHRWITPALLGALGFVAGSMVTSSLAHPQSASAASARVFEMRTYTTNEGRLPALETRFREHTMQLFEKHGMKNVGYWIPQDGEKHTNTLIYIISHESRDAAKANWKAFASDPEWQAVAKASEADGKILSKAPESVFMDPTTYSPIR
jgi:NIPSNAP